VRRATATRTPPPPCGEGVAAKRLGEGPLHAPSYPSPSRSEGPATLSPQGGEGLAPARGAVIHELTNGRLLLSHGPIDVVLKAFGAPQAVEQAHRAAAERFPGILPELCAELPVLRAPLGEGPPPTTSVGRRMHAACLPLGEQFVTPMAAVAGSVADELMAIMRAAAPLDRAYVNDGGDIAVFCAPGQMLDIAIAGDFTRGPVPGRSGTVRVRHGDGIGGIATSGARGRSFSLGIADSVTVLACDAATADAAATLIANAVNCDDPAIERRPAKELDPDSDLSRRLVTVHVGRLPAEKVMTALAAGVQRAREYWDRGLIVDAALTLQGETMTLFSSPVLERIAS
jgi:ApbE superfamily uncharacterized protein (UPF0280 family)